MAGNSFKSDESFLTKLAQGAAGTYRVIEDLRRQGHFPIILDKGSTNFKIWKELKIKAVRVPDILLLNLNQRIEARAKTDLDISMSHSARRPWYEGLEDSDYAAFVKATQSGKQPVDWVADELVQYVSVRSLRETYNMRYVDRKGDKGSGEGFEGRISWPSFVAKWDGVVEEMSSDRLVIRPLDRKRRQPIALSRNPTQQRDSVIGLTPLLQPNMKFRKSQVLASIVPVTAAIPVEWTATESTYVDGLGSLSYTTRYCSARALRYFSSSTAQDALIQAIDRDPEFEVKIEAAAALLVHERSEGRAFFAHTLSTRPADTYGGALQVEAVIALSDVPAPEARPLLSQVLLNETLHSEVRAGAAWALGEIADLNAIGALVSCFSSNSLSIRKEAARSVLQLANGDTRELINLLVESPGSETKAGLAWVLSQSQQVTASQIPVTLADLETRRWIAYILGTQVDRVVPGLEEIKETDPEVYFAATVLLQIMTSWIDGLETYG